MKGDKKLNNIVNIKYKCLLDVEIKELMSGPWFGVLMGGSAIVELSADDLPSEIRLHHKIIFNDIILTERAYQLDCRVLFGEVLFPPKVRLVIMVEIGLKKIE